MRRKMIRETLSPRGGLSYKTMCGILSVTGENIKNIDTSKISLMLASLSNRGPDDKGFLEFSHCNLGQTRLSIVDLSEGHQPMKDNKENIAITFNGEIYNYRELRESLEAKGHIFSTSSDTEVILKAYIEYGTECLKHLDGMFAFALWNEDKQELFLARDRFGKKPLYYTFDDNKNLLVSSEIKAFFASGKIKGEIDPSTLDHYLKFMYVPPHETIYKNIYTILPAHAGIFKDGELKTWRYWSLKHESIKISYDDAKIKIKDLFKKAVQKRMVADVEIGSLLSGGIDSTLVTAYAQKEMDRPIKTFTVGYGDYVNELPFAEEASKAIGTDHYALQVTGSFTDELVRVMAYFDEPHADSSDFAQHMISRLAGEKVKVVLTGDGADELFMGYGWYWRQFNLSTRHHTIEKFLTDPFKAHLNLVSIFSDHERTELWLPSFHTGPFTLPNEIRNHSLSSTEKINLFDLTFYLPGQLLTKIDRMSMMNSVEVRSPFLDTDLAEFVYNLPLEYKMNKNGGKIILKDILEEIMPKEFVHRRKQGFGAPVKIWLKEPAFKKLAEETLLNQDAELYRWLDKKVVYSLIEKFYTKGGDSYCYKIWVLLCLELWFQSHKQYHV